MLVWHTQSPKSHPQHHVSRAWWCTPIFPAPRKRRQGTQEFTVILSYMEFWANLGYMRLYLKENKNRGLEFSSVVEQLPSKHRALDSVVSSNKKKKKAKIKINKANSNILANQLLYLPFTLYIG